LKKLGILLAAALIAGTSFAGTVKSSGNCGCGIGTMALGDNPDTLLSELAATFLNGICGNGTFGITSGTLDCKPTSGVAMNSRVKEYVTANMDQIALDMAMGHGASLNALADLMNVPADKRGNVFGKLQNNFDKIFTTDKIGADDVVKNMASVLNG
jgi:hypothetical protein